MTTTEQTPTEQMAEALNQRARRLRENRHLWTDTRIAGTWASGKVAIVDAAALEELRQWIQLWTTNLASSVGVAERARTLLALAQTPEEQP
jgi:hypothetical protein